MLLVDSDAFILFGASGLLEQAGNVLGTTLQDMRRLDPLPYMLERGRLARKYPPAIRERVQSWCAIVPSIAEPPQPQTRDRFLTVEGIDPGEEILFGLLFERPDHILLSNDKRAMQALQSAPDLADIYERLCGRIACVEIVLAKLIATHGIEPVAEAVTPLRPYNGMLNAIFSMGTATPQDQCLDGLSSYIESLRTTVGRRFLLQPPTE